MSKEDFSFAKGVISNEIIKSVNTLNTIYGSKNLLNLFNENEELKNDYLQSAYNIAVLNGFKGVRLDKKRKSAGALF